MKTEQYIIQGDPGKLACTRYRTKKIYDIQKHSRIYSEIELGHQHDERPIHTKPVHFEVYFYMLASHNSKRSGLYHPYTPSLAKLLIFVEDLFKDIVIKDVFIISSITAHKKFDENPRIEINVTEL